jgi:hypothetical protein
MEDAAAGKDVSSKKFGKSQATMGKYEQHWQQGYTWLKELMNAKARTEQPPGSPSQGSLQSLSVQLSMENLAHTFDKISTQASPWVLALFIASKCFSDDLCGPATASLTYKDCSNTPPGLHSPPLPKMGPMNSWWKC